MSRLATAPPLALHATALTPLTVGELDTTRGGAGPFSIVAGIFLISAAAGMLDRLLFGGCKCS